MLCCIFNLNIIIIFDSFNGFLKTYIFIHSFYVLNIFTVIWYSVCVFCINFLTFSERDYKYLNF